MIVTRSTRIAIVESFLRSWSLEKQTYNSSICISGIIREFLWSFHHWTNFSQAWKRYRSSRRNLPWTYRLPFRPCFSWLGRSRIPLHVWTSNLDNVFFVVLHTPAYHGRSDPWVWNPFVFSEHVANHEFALIRWMDYRFHEAQEPLQMDNLLCKTETDSKIVRAKGELRQCSRQWKVLLLDGSPC
jgi:hypothetical protein